MNTLKPLTSPSLNQNKSTAHKTANLIESFKDQGKALTWGLGGSAWDQLAGGANRPQPQENFNFSEFLQSREQQVRNQERSLFERQRSYEVLVFHRKEEICKKEIEIIKQEIKTLVVQTGKLSSELVQAEKAVGGQTPDIKSGVYYFSFFERIRRLIKLAKKRITESRTWLTEFTGRCKAKSYYWGQTQKSGTKFMLSHERYMATQAG